LLNKKSNLSLFSLDFFLEKIKMENSLKKTASGIFGDSENSKFMETKLETKEATDQAVVDFLNEDKIALQKNIVKNIVMPNYVQDLVASFLWRTRWQRIGRVFFWTSNIFLLISGIFNFLQVEIPGTTLFSMGAGIGNIMVLMLLNFGADAKKESRLLTSDTNTLLQTVGLTTLHIPQSQENNFVSTVAKGGGGGSST
jgi:hypothetical protein